MQKLKYFILLFFGLWQSLLLGQKVHVSDEIAIHRADMYAILGQYQDQISFCSAEKGTLNLLLLDPNLRKIGEREIKLVTKFSTAKVLEIVPTRQDFLVLFSFRRKDKEVIKIHRYDPRGRLLDSATVRTIKGNFNVEDWKVIVSEDKQHLLLYEQEKESEIKASAVRLDSLKTIWEQTLTMPNLQQDNDRKDPLEVLFSNDATMYVIREFFNKKHTLKQHKLAITTLFGNSQQTQEIAMAEHLIHDIKFSFDNVNRCLVAGGLWGKDYERALGYFMLSLSANLATVKMDKHSFENELLTNLLKKKVLENKGIEDLKIRDLVLRRDGGCLLLVEKVLERRRHATNMMSPLMPSGVGAASLMAQTDYYNDDILALSLHADASKHWQTVLYKKQYSQNDKAVYSSYFLMKSALGIRLIYNDEIELKTTVSEYKLDGEGKMERRTLLNTHGNDLMLRFRDAVQISNVACLVPSESRSRVKIVKISY